MIWHRAAAKPFRPDSAVLVRPPSSKQHVTLATRRLAGANNGPFNQRGPRSIVAVGFPDKSARLLRLAGVGCLGRREQEKDGKRRRGGLGGGGVGGCWGCCHLWPADPPAGRRNISADNGPLCWNQVPPQEPATTTGSGSLILGYLLALTH